MKRRLSRFPMWLALIYFLWSVFAYFGGLGTDAHAWWPALLYPIIWPLSAAFEIVDKAVLKVVAPDPASAPSFVWDLNDYIAGGFYIIGGTVWMWCWGRVLSALATKLIPVTNKREASNAG